MRIAGSVLVVSCLFAVGCGGGEATPPAEAPAQPSALAPAPVPTAEPVAEAPQVAAPAAHPDEASASPTPEAKTDDADATRTVTYLVVPHGLKISVAGVKFAVSADAVKIAS